MTNFRVRTQLILLCVVALLGLGAMNALSLRDLRATMLEDRKSKVKTLVESAIGVVEHFRAQAKAGKLADAEARKAAVEALRKVRYDQTEYFFIFNTDLVYQLLDPKPQNEGKYFGDMKDSNGKLILAGMSKIASQGGGYFEYHFPKAGSDTPEPKLSYSALVPEWNWVVGTGVYIDDLDAAFWQRASWLIGELIALMLILLGFAWLITASILRQLGGEPRDGIQIMNRVATGDLLVNVGKAPPGSILGELGTMVAALRTMIAGIASDATTLDTQARHIATSSHEIATAANRQADATTSMAAAMEELTVSITHISDSSITTEKTSRDAAELSTEGVSQIGQTTASIQHIRSSVAQASEQIRRLDETARHISGIAAVIKDIAGQTNLLALNAAIEAARAGEQGRGFAVVADEVRKLAERTATATVDIERMVATVQTESLDVVGAMDRTLPLVENGVKQTQDIAELLAKIKQGAEATLGNLAEIAAATREQSAASTGIAVKVEDISQMAEETSSTVAQAEESAQDVERIARNLREIVDRFKV